MIEIPVKRKHVASKGLYGYPRTHSGNSRKKVKKIGGNGVFQPYNKRDHVRVLLPSMKVRMIHGDAAHVILGD